MIETIRSDFFFPLKVNLLNSRNKETPWFGFVQIHQEAFLRVYKAYWFQRTSGHCQLCGTWDLHDNGWWSYCSYQKRCNWSSVWLSSPMSDLECIQSCCSAELATIDATSSRL